MAEVVTAELTNSEVLSSLDLCASDGTPHDKTVRLLMQILLRGTDFLARDLPFPGCQTLKTVTASIRAWHVFTCRRGVCHAAVACSAASVSGQHSSCVEQSVGDSLSVATAPGSV